MPEMLLVSSSGFPTTANGQLFHWWEFFPSMQKKIAKQACGVSCHFMNKTAFMSNFPTSTNFNHQGKFAPLVGIFTPMKKAYKT